jgi:hypothetical protein
MLKSSGHGAAAARLAAQDILFDSFAPQQFGGDCARETVFARQNLLDGRG